MESIFNEEWFATLVPVSTRFQPIQSGEVTCVREELQQGYRLKYYFEDKLRVQEDFDQERISEVTYYYNNITHRLHYENNHCKVQDMCINDCQMTELYPCEYYPIHDSVGRIRSRIGNLLYLRLSHDVDYLCENLQTNETTSYYFHANGNIMQQETDIDDTLHGLRTTWWENGQIQSQIYYVNGQSQEGGTASDETGAPIDPNQFRLDVNLDDSVHSSPIHANYNYIDDIDWTAYNQSLQAIVEQDDEQPGCSLDSVPLVASGEQFDCPVCMNTITDSRYVTRCGHVFCQTCLANWCQSHQTCPLCRQLLIQ